MGLPQGICQAAAFSYHPAQHYKPDWRYTWRRTSGKNITNNLRETLALSSIASNSAFCIELPHHYTATRKNYIEKSSILAYARWHLVFAVGNCDLWRLFRRWHRYPYARNAGTDGHGKYS